VRPVQHNAARAEYVRSAALLLCWVTEISQLQCCATNLLKLNSIELLKKNLGFNVRFRGDTRSGVARANTAEFAGETPTAWRISWSEAETPEPFLRFLRLIVVWGVRRTSRSALRKIQYHKGGHRHDERSYFAGFFTRMGARCARRRHLKVQESFGSSVPTFPPRSSGPARFTCRAGLLKSLRLR
jgi:hypothetical protein